MKTFNVIGNALLNQKWIFAKTMPKIPHEYTLRKNWGNDSDFVDVVNFIRSYGYVEHFAGRPYTYLDVNGFSYWTMGAPVSETTLINRRKKDYQTVYDKISETYDSLFSDLKYDAENRAVLSYLPDIENKSILDIGCGTGLFLDYKNPSNYTGIDISKGMLDKLIAKHPDQKKNVYQTSLGGFLTDKKYDLIIALFGVASYLSSSELKRIPKLLSKNGTAFLMFYNRNYMPETYSKSGYDLAHVSFADQLDLPIIKLGNYSVVRITT